MTGIPQFNFPAFDLATAALRSSGWEIVSPAELDEPGIREEALASPDGTGVGEWKGFLARDISIICDPLTEAVIVLEGWEQSRGAQFETDVARRLGKPIFRYPDLQPVGGEVRVTDPDTGGQKGRKPERYDLIPFEALDELARVYGMGAEKYEAHNYLLGFDWSLSLGALLRHVTAWGKGEDRDPESGLSHLAHAAWHCFALMMFQAHHRGTDDRWRPGPSA